MTDAYMRDRDTTTRRPVRQIDMFRSSLFFYGLEPELIAVLVERRTLSLSLLFVSFSPFLFFSIPSTRLRSVRHRKVMATRTGKLD